MVTYNSRQVDIIARLKDKLVLDYPAIPGSLGVPLTINLISNVDELLEELKAKKVYEADPGAGTAWFTVYTVPTGKKVKIWSVNALRTSGTTLTTQYWRVSDPKNDQCRIHSYTAASDVVERFRQPLEMGERWTFDIYVQGYAANDKLGVYMVYKEYNAY